MMGAVLWIGGSPCSGKSTVAAAIAAARGLPLYSCDDAFERHAVVGGPTLKKVAGMTIGARLAQPIDVQVEDVFRLYREEFDLILRDLDAIGPAVVEGAALLPELLAGHGAAGDRAVWMVPTEAFQRRHYAARTWARDMVAGTADPGEAFDRWMRRDAVFAMRVAEQARELGYRVIPVDGTVAPEDLAAEVGRALAA
jgi:2-phosphoglycerate kinase